MGTFRRKVCDTNINYPETQIDNIRPCSRSLRDLNPPFPWWKASTSKHAELFSWKGDMDNALWLEF